MEEDDSMRAGQADHAKILGYIAVLGAVGLMMGWGLAAYANREGLIDSPFLDDAAQLFGSGVASLVVALFACKLALRPMQISAGRGGGYAVWFVFGMFIPLFFFVGGLFLVSGSLSEMVTTDEYGKRTTYDAVTFHRGEHRPGVAFFFLFGVAYPLSVYLAVYPVLAPLFQ